MTATTGDVGARFAGWHGYDDNQQARALTQARRHSRLVRRLRRVLPVLAGVLIVATLLANRQWMLAYGPVSVDRISVENGILKMENPRLSGYSQDDRAYEVSAAEALQDISAPNLVRLHDVVARITEQDGRWTTLNARSGLFHSGDETLRLENDIRVRTDQGYEMRLETADIEFKSGNVASDRPVEIDMPEGTLRADSMQIENSGDRILFSGNVSILYRPKVKENAVDGN
jgi:lipopolysaccharide export system protein LptC